MHPFLLSVFIFCIYFELIFKMKSVDNTSANPRISIAGNAVPKKIAATIVAATGSTLDNNPAYTLPAYFTAARYRQNGKIVPTITIVRNPTITIISRCASILHGLKNTASGFCFLISTAYNRSSSPAVIIRYGTKSGNQAFLRSILTFPFLVLYFHLFSDCFCAAYSLAHILYMPDISVILGDRTI